VDVILHRRPPHAGCILSRRKRIDLFNIEHPRPVFRNRGRKPL
jgi:hypothetical protein